MAETRLNLRRQKCPLPVLRTRKALLGAAAGDVLIVECTDPMVQIDIPALIRQTGDVLEHLQVEAGTAIFRIRKAGAAP